MSTRLDRLGRLQSRWQLERFDRLWRRFVTDSAMPSLLLRVPFFDNGSPTRANRATMSSPFVENGDSSIGNKIGESNRKAEELFSKNLHAPLSLIRISCNSSPLLERMKLEYFSHILEEVECNPLLGKRKAPHEGNKEANNTFVLGEVIEVAIHVGASPPTCSGPSYFLENFSLQSVEQLLSNSSSSNPASIQDSRTEEDRYFSGNVFGQWMATEFVDGCVAQFLQPHSRQDIIESFDARSRDRGQSLPLMRALNETIRPFYESPYICLNSERTRWLIFGKQLDAVVVADQPTSTSSYYNHDENKQPTIQNCSSSLVDGTCSSSHSSSSLQKHLLKEKSTVIVEKTMNTVREIVSLSHTSSQLTRAAPVPSQVLSDGAIHAVWVKGDALVSKRTGNSILILGPRGVGKTTAALHVLNQFGRSRVGMVGCGEVVVTNSPAYCRRTSSIGQPPISTLINESQVDKNSVVDAQKKKSLPEVSRLAAQTRKTVSLIGFPNNPSLGLGTLLGTLLPNRPLHQYVDTEEAAAWAQNSQDTIWMSGKRIPIVLDECFMNRSKGSTEDDSSVSPWCCHSPQLAAVIVLDWTIGMWHSPVMVREMTSSGALDEDLFSLKLPRKSPSLMLKRVGLYSDGVSDERGIRDAEEEEMSASKKCPEHHDALLRKHFLLPSHYYHDGDKGKIHFADMLGRADHAVPILQVAGGVRFPAICKLVGQLLEL